MLETFLKEAILICDRYPDDPRSVAEILDAQFGSTLSVRGVSRIIGPAPYTLVLAIRGRREPQASESNSFGPCQHSLELNINLLKTHGPEETAKNLNGALQSFILDGEGAHSWVVPDGFMANLSEQEKQWASEGGGYFSHEALCVQNTGARDAHCELFVFFEEKGREVLRHRFEVSAEQSVHLRLDKIQSSTDKPFISKDSPVGYKVVSYDEPIVVQGSRILTSGKGSEFASFGTVIAWTGGR